MPKIAYIEAEFRRASLEQISQANAIIAKYQAEGFSLTLRQLYYQFVARNLVRNTERSYKNLGNVINKARLAGLIDWSAIEDRTRNVRGLNLSASPYDVVADIEERYHVDMWENQAIYPEVWIEKDALVGVISDVCLGNHVDYLACKGYASQSEMWRGAVRMIQAGKKGRDPVIFYLGDHDPSGMDMSRDLAERMRLFGNAHGVRIRVVRLALNPDQVEQYDPPPNPTKITDTRAGDYIEEYGHESWELDALEPAVIAALVQAALDDEKDWEQWRADEDRQAEGRKMLVDAKHHVQTLLGR